jgi:hypothetical protein
VAKIICTCGKTVETQPDWGGQWITCPGCAGALYAPFPGPKPSPPAATSRLCPWCAETISLADMKCTFCGGDPDPRPVAAPVATPVLRTDPGGVTELVLGIAGFMFCQLLSPIAWSMGSSYEAKCRENGLEPSGAGRAGKILGIVGSIFLILWLVFLALSLGAQCR